MFYPHQICCYIVLLLLLKMRYIYFKYMLLINIQHTNTHIKSSAWFTDKRILTISHNAYPDNLAPTEENHINRISLVSCCYLQLLPYSQKSAAWTFSISHVYKTSHMIVVVISCCVYNLLCSSHNHITF